MVYKTQKKRGDIIIVKKKKAGTERLVLTLNALPGLTLDTTAPRWGWQNLSHGLYFFMQQQPRAERIYHEYVGKRHVSDKGIRCAFQLTSPLNEMRISAGNIRRGDSRITGDTALRVLRNRREQLVALAKWMHSREGAPDYTTQKAFEKYWKPILMPELVSKKRCPPEWQTTNVTWKWAEEVKWNTAYTSAVFPKT